MYMLFHQMFEEVPTKPHQNKDPTKLAPQVRDFVHMMELFNAIVHCLKLVH